MLPKSDIDPEHCRVSAQLDDNVSVCACVRACVIQKVVLGVSLSESVHH